MPLSGGDGIPVLGFGTYKATGTEGQAAVAEALRAGYRSIDTASVYGNEAEVGRALQNSGVPREEVFVATKVWNDEQGFEGTLEAAERSLSRLGLDYVDLYLVHWPVPELMRDTWRAMEELLRRGRARSIGVCNHLVHHLEELLASATVPPAVNQIEFHPWLQQPALADFCREHGIIVEAWAPIVRGRVAEIPEIAGIAATHGKTAPQVSLRWILQKGHVAIPKSVHAERIAENADIFDFTLDDEEMAVLDGLDAGERIGPHPDSFLG
jgi:diketogulonate reductase-like aldo/keto reductase